MSLWRRGKSLQSGREPDARAAWYSLRAAGTRGSSSSAGAAGPRRLSWVGFMSGFQHAAELHQGAGPDLLDAVHRAFEPLGDLGERQPLQVPQHDHVAVVLGQLL